ncbi:glycosyltransferase family 4 protein [bacterium]|nr:glycosyltransferase family 4 protein [bacterium]
MKFQVVVASSYWSLSGVNIFSENLVRGLRRIGVDAHLLLTEQHSNLVTIGDSLMPLPSDIPVEFLPVKPNEQWGSHWGAMIRYLEDRAPCVYVPNADWRHSCICPRLSRRVSVVGVVHSDDPLHYDHVRRLGDYWDAVATVSKTVAQKTAKVNDSVKHRIVTIPIGVESAKNYPERDFSKPRPLRLIYHGLLIQRQKRIFDLPRILEALQRAQVPFEMTIAGAGEQQDQLLNDCKSFVEDGTLHFLGLVPHSEMLKILEEQDVFLMTSEFEGMPNALLEAMGRGCVPVVTDIHSGIPELIRHESNGYLVTVGDIRAFAEHLTCLQQNSDLLEKMSRSAYRTIESGPFNVTHMAKEYHALFRRVLVKSKFHLYRRPVGPMVSPPASVDGVNIFPVKYYKKVKGVGQFLSDWDWDDFRRTMYLMGESHKPEWRKTLPRFQVIAAVPGTNLSGIPVFSQNLVAGLNERGIQSRVLLTEPDYNFPFEVPVDRLALESSDSLGARWGSMIQYLEHAATCVYIPNNDWRNACVVPKLSNNISVVGIAHKDDAEYYENVTRYGRYWNAIVAVSRKIAASIREQNPNLANRIITISYGTSIPPALPVREWRNGQKLRIVYHGSLLQTQKRILDLPRILERLNHQGTSAELIVAGNGPDIESFVEASKVLIEKGWIRFLGALPHKEVLPLLEQQDVFLMTSEFEGMPQALLEAMGRGCIPVVSEVASGIPELIKNGVNGFTAPVGDIDTFVERLAGLSRELGLRQTMSQRAYETIRDGPFQTKDMIKDYVELFQTTLYDAKYKFYRRPRGTIFAPEFHAASSSYKVPRVGVFPSRADYEDFYNRVWIGTENKHFHWLKRYRRKTRNLYWRETRRFRSSFHDVQNAFSKISESLQRDRTRFSESFTESKRLLRKRVKKARRLGFSRELLNALKSKGRSLRHRRHKSRARK